MVLEKSLNLRNRHSDNDEATGTNCETSSSKDESALGQMRNS